MQWIEKLIVNAINKLRALTNDNLKNNVLTFIPSYLILFLKVGTNH